MAQNPRSPGLLAFPKTQVLVLVGAMAVAAAGSASAASVAVSTGTGAPPATLGPFSLVPFPDDASLEGGSVSSLPSPLGGDLQFSPAVQHLVVPGTWSTWSQGNPAGLDVYFSNGASSVNMALPPQTQAFHFYAQPNNFSVYTIRAEHQDGTFLELDVDGSAGATGYGFYVTDASYLTSILVTSAQGAAGFALAQFQIAGPDGSVGEIPEPGTFLAGALIAAAAWPILRRRRATATAVQA